MRLGVNIDHIATVRQARREEEPDLLAATKEVLNGGADLITVHLREDKRHIQPEDVIRLRALCPVLNLEMAATGDMVRFAQTIRPDWCCIVPEKREELTTEGGLDALGLQDTLKHTVRQLQTANIRVSLFIEADPIQIQAAKAIGADAVELHTGTYANATPPAKQETERIKLQKAAELGHKLGLRIHAGHGLKYHNTAPITQILYIEELNIGHSIISYALFVGLKKAVKKMKEIIG